MKHIVFDIGAVLVDWQPYLAWSNEMNEAEANAFMKRVNFDKLNVACDAGATFALASQHISDPVDAARVAQYVDRYALTVKHKIIGTWEILYALKGKNIPIHAITNWSAETWGPGVSVHPELEEVFETTIVSGEVGMVKPSVDIFRLLCSRAKIEPQDCIFIDDGLHNCIGAKAAGMDAIHFTDPETLKLELQKKGVL